jgi:hypothetical protein
MMYGTENLIVEKWMEFTKLMRVFWDKESCTFVDGLGTISWSNMQPSHTLKIRQ